MTSAPALKVSGMAPVYSTHSVVALFFLILQPELDVTAGFGARKAVLGNGAEEAGGLQFVGGGSERFGDIEEIDAVFGKAGIRKIADASPKNRRSATR